MLAVVFLCCTFCKLDVKVQNCTNQASACGKISLNRMQEGLCGWTHFNYLEGLEKDACLEKHKLHQTALNSSNRVSDQEEFQTLHCNSPLSIVENNCLKGYPCFFRIKRIRIIYFSPCIAQTHFEINIERSRILELQKQIQVLFSTGKLLRKSSSVGYVKYPQMRKQSLFPTCD